MKAAATARAARTEEAQLARASASRRAASPTQAISGREKP